MSKAPISQIDNSYTRAKTQEDAQNAATTRRKRVHRRRLMTLGVLLVIVFAVGMVRLHTLKANQTAVNADVQSANKRLSKAEKRKKALKVQVDQLNNEAYLEKLVRSKYYVSKSGEVIFNLPADVNRIKGITTK